MTHDERRTGLRSGILLGLVSAVTFGTSGVLARGLLAAGWSTGGIVTARAWVAGLVLLIPAWHALDGRWGLLRRNLPLLLAYGAVAVAGAQLAYFNAVARLDVAVALLIEYTAPLAVVGWLWARHGHVPSRLTALGAATCLGGLVLVLDVVGGFTLDPAGVLWALLAMVATACYFVVSAQEGNGLPPLVLAAGGLLAGAAMLTLLGLTGGLALTWTTSAAVYDVAQAPWWLPVLLLGVLAGALPYTFGIAASRLLGSRLASFVALTEVVSAVGWAWLVLGELPAPIQLAGGVLILAGVVLVKLGEPGRAREVSARPAGG